MINEVYKMQQLAGLIEESSLSRVYKHIGNKDIPVAIVTAFRGENTPEKNKNLNVQLAGMVRGSGYGFFYVDGFWIENKGEENEKHVSEDAVFVVGNENDNGKLLKLMMKLMKKYKQEAIVFKKEGDNRAILVYNSGKEEMLGKFHPRVIGPAYTKLRKKKGVFTFNEGVDREKNKNIDKRMKKAKEYNRKREDNAEQLQKVNLKGPVTYQKIKVGDWFHQGPTTTDVKWLNSKNIKQGTKLTVSLPDRVKPDYMGMKGPKLPVGNYKVVGFHVTQEGVDIMLKSTVALKSGNKLFKDGRNWSLPVLHLTGFTNNWYKFN